MKAILTTLFFAICINILSQSDIEFKQIIEDDYSISYPNDWELGKSGLMGTSFIVFSPLVSEQDQFRENVNLLIQDLSAYNIDLDMFVEISEGQIKTMIKNGNLLQSERLKKGDQEYQKVIYTGDQGNYKLKFEQYYLVKNNNAYILTLTCETQEFDDYHKIGENILDSFKLK